MTGSRPSLLCRSAPDDGALVCTSNSSKTIYSASTSPPFSARCCATCAATSSSSGITPASIAVSRFGISVVGTDVSTSNPCHPMHRNSTPSKPFGHTPKGNWPMDALMTRTNCITRRSKPSVDFGTRSATYERSSTNRLFPFFCPESCFINAEVNNSS